MTQVNSAFYPSGAGKLSTSLSGWGVFTCVGWQVTLWQGTSGSCEMEFH